MQVASATFDIGLHVRRGQIYKRTDMKRRKDRSFTWAHETVMWWLSVDARSWQLSIQPHMDGVYNWQGIIILCLSIQITAGSKCDIWHWLTCKAWTDLPTYGRTVTWLHLSHPQVTIFSYPWCSAARALHKLRYNVSKWKQLSLLLLPVSKYQW